MGKRSHEESSVAVDQSAEGTRDGKRVKKEKEAKKAKKAVGEGSASTSGACPGDARHTVAEQEVAAGLSREERRASKRARKEQAAATGKRDAAGEAVAKPKLKAGNARYHEHVALSALPQSDIDDFISEKQLTIEDPHDQPDFRPITSFDYLPIHDAQRPCFADFHAPTPIQAAVWPYLLAGRDVVGVAETGSGKTLAFGVPCVNSIASLPKKERDSIKACIASPTRELAQQIHQQLLEFAQPAGLKVTCIYGGASKDAQRAQLPGTHIVVATPGRLYDFIQEGAADLSHVAYLVLDEADRILDRGFEEHIRHIISSTQSTGRQTLMFTATWPPSVRDLADTFMTDPVRVTIGGNASGELRANPRITQQVQVMTQPDKQPRLIALLKQYQSGANKTDRILVFCLYKKEATRIEDFLRRRGFPVAGIHGDLPQAKRQASLESFKRGDIPILVATDVAARGLDIPSVKLVVNVTFPLTPEDYVHRIGRTGRAGQDGRAITFFTDQEKGLAGALINVLKKAGQPVPEELMKFGTTVKKKEHEVYGKWFKETDGEMKKPTKITFD